MITLLCKACSICEGELALAIDLPGFVGGAQALLQCVRCGHGQLENRREPACDYLSGSTEYSRRGAAWFLSHVGGKFECALDFGCNDGYLLRQLRAGRLIGVDNAALSIGFECHAELDSVDAEPDLVVSRHTLEHLADPLGTLRALVAKAAAHAQFAIEVPCLDLLAESLRFDQIYNDHLQYFTAYSFRMMLRAAGLKVEHFALHRHPHSMLALCVKGTSVEIILKMPDLSANYRAFKTWMLATGNAFMLSERRVAYGASAIFPVLLYHLGIEASQLHAVYDDARGRWGEQFHGHEIQPPDAAADATLLITAPDSHAQIARKCEGARHVMASVPML